jgi:hypothetical protein
LIKRKIEKNYILGLNNYADLNTKNYIFYKKHLLKVYYERCNEFDKKLFEKHNKQKTKKEKFMLFLKFDFRNKR